MKRDHPAARESLAPTEQSLRERLLRVGTVDFDTAGSDDSEFRFVGISEPATVVAAVDRAQASVRDPNLA